MRKKRILVAVLNWGLGHATRCIPIINELKSLGFEVIIASDGEALQLLKKEFPGSQFEELPSYNIKYTSKGYFLKWKLMIESPKFIKTIKAENDLTEVLVEKYGLTGIISDNRWGVRSKKLKKNVFITHQLNVLSGNTTFLSSFIQEKYINKFDECWIPDLAGDKNLSGILGHKSNSPKNVKYIGLLSRMKKQSIPEIYDYLILLSGPEPQRSILESILLKEFKTSEARILFIRGVISEEKLDAPLNMNIKNYLFGEELEKAVNESKYVISRSGYTTLMDLARLKKKAFFIPTPGQKEQEYLAERLKKLKIAPYCKQEDFNLSKLEKIENYKGLSNFGNYLISRDLFTLFESE